MSKLICSKTEQTGLILKLYIQLQSLGYPKIESVIAAKAAIESITQLES